jgi:hypothetical protein
VRGGRGWGRLRVAWVSFMFFFNFVFFFFVIFYYMLCYVLRSVLF